MHKNQKYHPVGLLLAEEVLFGLPLAEKWSSANTCSPVLENSYQLGFLVF
jgi:hypothetical protein